MADPLSTIVSDVTNLLKFAVMPLSQQLRKGFVEPRRLMDSIEANTNSALASLFAIPDAYRGNLGTAPDKSQVDTLRVSEVDLAAHLVGIKKPQDLSPKVRNLIQKAADDLAKQGFAISKDAPIRYLFGGRACGAAMVGFCVAGAKRGFVLDWAQRYLDVAKKASEPLAATLSSAQSDAATLAAEVASWTPVHSPNRWGIFCFGSWKDESLGAEREPRPGGPGEGPRRSWINRYGDITGNLDIGFSGSHQDKIQSRANQDGRALFPGGGSYDEIQQRINGMSQRFRTARSAAAAINSHPKANETVAAQIARFISAVPLAEADAH
jgi:hypothetical protein